MSNLVTPKSERAFNTKAETQLNSLPLLRLGFRPFYLAAALFACVAIPFWIALFLGKINISTSVPPLFWHAHEMLFGFAIAVIVGFLMTAIKAWTSLTTPRGPTLGALVLLWIAARIAAVTGPYGLYAMLDLAFLPIIAALLAAILLRANNRRNLGLIALLLLLSIANFTFHLAVNSIIVVSPMKALHAALALIVLIQCVMAGRVVPAFTGAMTPGLKIVAQPFLEKFTLGMTALALSLWIFTTLNMITALALLIAASLHFYRQMRWHPWSARTRPILWILHIAYLWMTAGLILLGLAASSLISQTVGVHALAIGLTGGLTLGMMTRTARGHTGRNIQASGAEVTAYSLLIAACALRVLVPLAAPEWYVLTLIVAASAWSGAFGLYLYVYAPWLLSARLDGKDG